MHDQSEQATTSCRKAVFHERARTPVLSRRRPEQCICPALRLAFVIKRMIHTRYHSELAPKCECNGKVKDPSCNIQTQTWMERLRTRTMEVKRRCDPNSRHKQCRDEVKPWILHQLRFGIFSHECFSQLVLSVNFLWNLLRLGNFITESSILAGRFERN